MDPQMLRERISQWENMTDADPDNAMGWFSLGGAYKDAEEDEQAARALRKAIELDPGLSRAYQLLGQVLIKADAKDQAAEILTRGYTTAAERGDVMPQRAMGSLLETLGQPIPEVQSKTPAAPPPGTSGDAIVDRRTGQPGTRLDTPPLRGPTGKFIFDHYSSETWYEWIGMGTKVINELRLDFSKIEHQELYDANMLEWLGFTEAEAIEYAEQSEDV